MRRLLGFVLTGLMMSCGSDGSNSEQPAGAGSPRGELNGRWRVTSRACGSQSLTLESEEWYQLDTAYVANIQVESRSQEMLCMVAFAYHRLVLSAGGGSERWDESAHLKSIEQAKRECWRLEDGERVEPPVTSELVPAATEDLMLELTHTSSGLTMALENTPECKNGALHLTLTRS